MNRRRLDWSGWCRQVRALRRGEPPKKTGRNCVGPVRDFRRLGVLRTWVSPYTRYMQELILWAAQLRKEKR